MATELTQDEERLRGFLSDPNVPEAAKRQAASAFKATQGANLGGDTSTTTTRTSTPQTFGEYLTSRDPFTMFGGMVGGATGGMTAGPAGAVAGAGLGQSIAGSAYDLVNPPVRRNDAGQITVGNSPVQTVTQGVSDFSLGAGAEAGGQVMSRVLDPLVDKVVQSRMAKAGQRAVRQRRFTDYNMPYMPSDVAPDSNALALTERAAGTPFTGNAIQRNFRDTQMRRAGEITKQFIGDATESNPGATGQRVVKSLGASAAKWKRETGALFDAIEAEAGDQRVVPTQPIRDAISRVVARKQNTAQQVGGMTAALRAGLKANKRAVRETGSELRNAFLSRPDEVLRTIESQYGGPAKDVFKAFMDARTGGFMAEDMGDDALASLLTAMRDDHIPFSLAREIEAQFGEAARRGPGKMVGSLRQGEYGAIRRGVKDSIDQFLSSSDDLGPKMAEAKQAWATGKANFNGVLGTLKDSQNPSAIVAEVFTPKRGEDIAALRWATDNDTWNALTGEWRNQLVARATNRDGQVVPSKLAYEIHRYGPVLDEILPPAEADRFREIGTMFRDLGRAERGVANTSRTAGTLGDVSALSGVVASLVTGNPTTAAGIALGQGAVPAAMSMALTRKPNWFLNATPADPLKAMADPATLRVFLQSLAAGGGQNPPQRP